MKKENNDQLNKMLAYMLNEDEQEIIQPEYIHMITTKEEIILDTVHKMCDSVTEEDIPTDKTWDIAKEILTLVGVSPGYSIHEIPRCWDDKVNIRFYYPETETIFDVVTGVMTEDQNIFFLDIFAEYDANNKTHPCGEVYLYKDKAIINEDFMEEK